MSRKPKTSPTPAAAPVALTAIAGLTPELRERCVTVRGLVKALTGFDLPDRSPNGANLDAVVVIQHDPEGNGYGPLDVEAIYPDTSTISPRGCRFELDDLNPGADTFKRGEETVVVLAPMG
jgi:hypothetical protein